MSLLDYKRIKYILDNDLPRVIYCSKHLMIGKFCYVEPLPHNRFVLRKRLINYKEVEQLPQRLQNTVVSLVSGLNEDNFIATKRGRMTKDKIKLLWDDCHFNTRRLNELIESGFIEPIEEDGETYYKLTKKSILPRNKKLEFKVMDSDRFFG